MALIKITLSQLQLYRRWMFRAAWRFISSTVQEMIDCFCKKSTAHFITHIYSTQLLREAFPITPPQGVLTHNHLAGLRQSSHLYSQGHLSPRWTAVQSEHLIFLQISCTLLIYTWWSHIDELFVLWAVNEIMSNVCFYCSPESPYVHHTPGNHAFKGDWHKQSYFLRLLPAAWLQ